MKNTSLTHQNTVKALHIERLSHAFGGKKALNEVNVSISAREFCVLLGLNGAGKTTLFSLITRLYDSTSGRISVCGYDVRSQSIEALDRLGVVFQKSTVDSDLSVLQNLIYHGALRGFGKKKSIQCAERELDRIGLLDRAHEKIRSLSGGQVRRVEIARALMHSPKLLILDEPTVGLDIESRAAIVDHIRDLTARESIGVLWATHLFDEAQMADRAYILHLGRVVTQGLIKDLIPQAGADDLKGAFTHFTRVSLQEETLQ